MITVPQDYSSQLRVEGDSVVMVNNIWGELFTL